MARRRPTTPIPRKGPEELAIVVQTRDLYKNIIQGKTIPEIAQEMGLAERTVKNIMLEAHKRLTAEIQVLTERYTNISYARLEWVMSKLMTALEKQIDGDKVMGTPDAKLVGLILDVIEMEGKILNPKAGQGGGKLPVTINQTFTTTSPLYDEGLAAVQIDYMGSTFQPEEFVEKVIRTPETDEIEELAAEFLSDSEFVFDD